MDGIELFEKRVFMRQRESRNSDRDRSNDSRGDRYDYLHDYSSPLIFSYREQRSGSPPLWKTDSPRLDGGRGRRDREVFATPPQRHRQGGGWNRYEDQYGTPQVSYSKPFDSVITFFVRNIGEDGKIGETITIVVILHLKTNEIEMVVNGPNTDKNASRLPIFCN